MVVNPLTALIEVHPPDNVAQFRLIYRKDGAIVANLVVDANYVTDGVFSQSLAALNALVGAGDQNANLAFSAASKNAGGESTAVTATEVVQIVNAPAVPTSAHVS